MGDGQIIDAMMGALTDPFGTGHMGITAENLAAKYGFTREQQDAFSLESHRRAAAAHRRRPLQDPDRPGGAQDRRRAR